MTKENFGVEWKKPKIDMMLVMIMEGKMKIH